MADGGRFARTPDGIGMGPQRTVLQRLAAVNAGAQAVLAAAYAWGITVAPAAWSRGAPAIAKVVAVASLVTLGAVLAEPRFGKRARRVGLWGFVVGSAVVWSTVPGALAPLRVDTLRGVAGALGWALLGFTLAAPARLPSEGARTASRALPPRQVLARGDAAFLVAGVLLAAGLQVMGWRVSSVERSLLVRLVIIASSMALVATSAELALVRHKRTSEVPARVRLRAAMLSLVALGFLALVGALSALRAW
jgi:hypothetical protein